MPNDAKYLELILNPIRVCAQYKPKFGQGAKGDGLTLAQFQQLYQSDPFYSWFGLDNPMMYAAHKAAGGMTSVYRQIGIGCEKLFRVVLQDALNLNDADTIWSYEVPLPNPDKPEPKWFFQHKGSKEQGNKEQKQTKANL
jgi:hypothetical protein